MSLKYRTSAGTSASNFTDLVVKVGDTLPIGAIIGFDTTGTIPNGWEYYAENQIKKISPTTPANGNIENQYGTSQTNAYSEEYSNNTFASKNIENYSTTETKIGTWIDGKPLYRICFDSTTGSTANRDSIVADCSSLNIDKILFLNGTLNGTAIKIPANYFYSNTNYGSLYYDTIAGKILAFATQYTSTPIQIILEYTKTTD